jgi:hypothetical protein
MKISRLLFFGGFLLVAIALDARGATRAAQYCAQYNNGTQDCGIPSLNSCQQSVRGVGGICVVDTRSRRRNRWLRFPQANPYPDPTMPPPPFN